MRVPCRQVRRGPAGGGPSVTGADGRAGRGGSRHHRDVGLGAGPAEARGGGRTALKMVRQDLDEMARVGRLSHARDFSKACRVLLLK